MLIQVPSAVATPSMSRLTCQIRSRSCVRSATRCSRLAFSSRRASSAACRSFMSRRMAVTNTRPVAQPSGCGYVEERPRSILASRNQFHGTQRGAAGQDLCPRVPAIAEALRRNVPTGARPVRTARNSVSRTEAELTNWTMPSASKREDDVRGAFDDGIVACVLTIAQDAIAMRGAGDIGNLEEAVRIGALAERPDRNIVDQRQAGPRSKRQQIPVERMRQEGGRAQRERFGDRRRQTNRAGVPGNISSKVFPLRLFGGNIARGRKPVIPADYPLVSVQHDDARIQSVESGGKLLTLKPDH